MTKTGAVAFGRVLAIIALAMAAVAMPASAQDDDNDDDDDDDNGFAAYIHEGTVDDYDDRPVEEAGELEVVRDADDDDDNNDVWDVIGNDDPEPDPLYGDDEDIDLTIDELTSDPHVLVVHADDDSDSQVIAIGAIEGDVESAGTLMIELEEVDDSGYEGRTHFAPDDDDSDDDDDDDDDDNDDDDETEVTVGIWDVQPAGV